MNAKETVDAVKGMLTLTEVKELLNLEKKADKPRKRVINACEERVGELTLNNEAEAPAKDPVTSKKKVDEKEAGRIMDFKRKVGWIRCPRIEDFAKAYFTDDLKSVETTKYVVTIVLKSGTKFEQRGH